MTTVTRLLLLSLIGLLALLTPARQAAPPDPVGLHARTQMHTLVVNSWWETNCYILVGRNRQAIIIDPGDELEQVTPGHFRPTGEQAEKILNLLRRHRVRVRYIVLTHGHIDHIGAVGFLKEKTGAQILMHAGDIRPPGDQHDGTPKDTHMLEGGLPTVDRVLQDGDLISLDGMVLQVIHTPGHSPGSICLRTKRGNQTLLFSGDTLFRGTIGRTNFRDGSGDEALLIRMIREKLFTLPDDTLVYPGHYETTTIGHEKAHNWAIRFYEEFIEQ